MRLRTEVPPRVWVVVLLAVLTAPGCRAAPPYRVSATRPLPAEHLQRLGRIELIDVRAPGAREGATLPVVPPQVWVEVPDRRAEASTVGVIFGGAAGAVIGAAVGASGGGMFVALGAAFGAIVGAPVGAAAGGTLGAMMGAPGSGTRREAVTIREVAWSTDVAAAARDGARQSPALAANGAAERHSTAGAGGLLSVEVLAYGTRDAGDVSARPFVAVRTRLAEVAGGRVVYESTRDWHGPRRRFKEWAAGGGAEFGRALEDGTRELARRTVDEATTPARAGRR